MSRIVGRGSIFFLNGICKKLAETLNAIKMGTNLIVSDEKKCFKINVIALNQCSLPHMYNNLHWSSSCCPQNGIQNYGRYEMNKYRRYFVQRQGWQQLQVRVPNGRYQRIPTEKTVDLFSDHIPFERVSRTRTGVKDSSGLWLGNT